jgi:ferritin-like metal-binding protein YciE
MNLQRLLLDELGDLLHVENLLLKALPKMALAAEAPQLKAQFQSHLQETQKHVERLAEVFSLCEAPFREKKCEGMLGILTELQQLVQRTKHSPVLDAALIASARRIESYEITGYQSAASWCELLGAAQATKLLKKTLSEEERCDQKIAGLIPNVEKNIRVSFDAPAVPAPARSVATATAKANGQPRPWVAFKF